MPCGGQTGDSLCMHDAAMRAGCADARVPLQKAAARPMKERRARPPPMTLAATPSLAAPAGLDDSRLLPAGTCLDEFEILRPLGIGGFGIVYLALDRSLLRQVALKEFMPVELAARGPGGIVGPRSPASSCVEKTSRSMNRCERVRVPSSAMIATRARYRPFSIGVETSANV
jgi:hypothetical protein